MGHSGFSSLTIAAQHIFDGTELRGAGSIRISNGRIESVSPSKAASRASIQLPSDAILAPGFVDIQVNGGGGVLLNDGLYGLGMGVRGGGLGFARHVLVNLGK